MHHAEQGIAQRLKAQTSNNQLHLVHRLDTATSGCLLLAKHKQAAAELGVLFQARQISKYYIALLDKKPKRKQGSIVGDMKNRRGGQWALLHSRENPAVTQFFTESVKPGLRLALVRPITGKTHQIRVAMKSLGASIIGDQRYTGSTADRLYLHAWHLSFTYHGQQITCQALPEHGQLFAQTEVEDWFDNAPSPDTLSWPTMPQFIANKASC